MIYEVMTPRTDLKAMALPRDSARLLEFARAAKHSKFPVYKESIDSVRGLVYAKDIF